MTSRSWTHDNAAAAVSVRALAACDLPRLRRYSILHSGEVGGFKAFVKR